VPRLMLCEKGKSAIQLAELTSVWISSKSGPVCVSALLEAMTLLPKAEFPLALAKLNAILALSKSGEQVRTSRSMSLRRLLTLGELPAVAKECRRGVEGLPLKSLKVRSRILAVSVASQQEDSSSTTPIIEMYGR